jgi:hypothetical protein
VLKFVQVPISDISPHQEILPKGGNTVIVPNMRVTINFYILLKKVCDLGQMRDHLLYLVYVLFISVV